MAGTDANRNNAPAATTASLVFIEWPPRLSTYVVRVYTLPVSIFVARFANVNCVLGPGQALSWARTRAGGTMLVNRQTAMATAAILAVIAAGTAVSRAQENAGAPLRRVGGHLDLSGVWQAPYVPDMTRDGRGQKGEPNLPFTPAGEQNWKTYDPADGDYTGSCLPFGLSRSMNA